MKKIVIVALRLYAGEVWIRVWVKVRLRDRARDGMATLAAGGSCGPAFSEGRRGGSVSRESNCSSVGCPDVSRHGGR